MTTDTDRKSPRFPPRGDKRYQICRYDLSDEPAGDASFRLEGECDSPDEALACARSVIDRELTEYAAQPTTAAMLDHYESFGEGVTIFGEPRLYFDFYEYARARATTVFARTRRPSEASEPPP